MEGNFINNIFSKVKNKFNNKNNDNYSQTSLYSFSGEEIDDISRQNRDAINRLRNNTLDNKNNIYINKDNVNKEVDVIDDNVKEKIILDNDDNDNVEISSNDYGYINLSDERKNNIMKRWNSIDFIRLNKDIESGKDILNHNYIVTYADNALSYIYRIRDEYDILIEYLIGFNNEKRGILNKNIFSDKLENEWKYLGDYIKVLEKIRRAINR